MENKNYENIVEAAESMKDIAIAFEEQKAEIEALKERVKELEGLLDEARDHANHNAKLVTEERNKHWIYKKDGELAAYRSIVMDIIERLMNKE